MIKKIGIKKIVFACVAVAMLVAGLILYFAVPKQKAFSNYYVYSSNSAKIEVHIENNEFYTVTKVGDEDPVTSEKVAYFIQDGRIFLNTTKQDYKALTNTQKSEILSFKISKNSLDYYTDVEHTEVGTFGTSEYEVEPNSANIMSKTLNMMKTSIISGLGLVFLVGGALFTLIAVVKIIKEVTKIKNENKPKEQTSEEKAQKPKFSFKSIQDKINKKVLIVLAITSCVLITAGALFATGKFASHLGSYSINDINLPTSIKDSGKSSYKILFTKNGVVECYATKDHYIISEPTVYVIRNGRLFIGFTKQDYKDTLKEFDEFEMTKQEKKETLDLLSDKISTVELETDFVEVGKTLVFKSPVGSVLQIIGYVMLGIGALVLIEFLYSLSQKFVYLVVLSRAPVPAGAGEGGADVTLKETETLPPPEAESAEPEITKNDDK